MKIALITSKYPRLSGTFVQREINGLKKSGAIITDWQGGNNFLKGEVIVSSNSYIHKKFIKYFKTKVR